MHKCVIFYASQHHLNTEKLVKAIAKEGPHITILPIHLNTIPNLDEDSYIGFASGIYKGNAHPEMMDFIRQNKDCFINKKIFTILTSGSNAKKYGTCFHSYLRDQGLSVTDGFQCKGYDTYGLFKYIGGIAKGHPNTTDINHAITFIKTLEYII